ncbi:Laminin subunit alpha-3 [Dissostichus eleginoides]|nr:Laminin subunit alpha-3 [Dissostichus eleginoides]
MAAMLGRGNPPATTCGQDENGTPRHELYCKLVGGLTYGLPSQNIPGQYCDYCNAIDPNKAHPVTNAIDGTERWWQSPPLSMGQGYNEVNVTLDLKQYSSLASRLTVGLQSLINLELRCGKDCGI